MYLSVLPAVFITLRLLGRKGQPFYFLQIVKIMGLNRRVQLHTLQPSLNLPISCLQGFHNSWICQGGNIP
jgi:hypothetical protein